MNLPWWHPCHTLPVAKDTNLPWWGPCGSRTHYQWPGIKATLLLVPCYWYWYKSYLLPCYWYLATGTGTKATCYLATGTLLLVLVQKLPATLLLVPCYWYWYKSYLLPCYWYMLPVTKNTDLPWWGACGTCYQWLKIQTYPGGVLVVHVTSG